MARLKELLAVYACVLFSQSPWVGALLFVATATVPRVGGFGLVAIACASLTLRALAVPRDGMVARAARMNALLCGLALAAATRSAPWLVPLASVATVFATAALQSVLARLMELPPLSVPFLVVFWLALAVGVPAVTTLPPLPLPIAIPPSVVDLVTACGALFAVPTLSGGALVVAALVIHSRIAVVLAFGALFIARAFAMAVPLPSELVPALAYNAMLTAIALGGIWFVPSRASFGLALAGTLVAALVTAGTRGFVAGHALPISVLPFNVAVLTVLLAMRQRTRDDLPKAVERAGATPEETLALDRQSRGRLRTRYAVSLRAPFRGRWLCTQSTDGAHTHRGAWRHAFDFEVAGADGRTHTGGGTRVADYHCYGLPVLATAPGTVVRVGDSVPDNGVGEANVVENWGNHVIVCHAPGLYSLVAHLMPGSLRVREGQVVAAGEQLAACGSSGRSPVPHLHFQLQATPELGAPTLPCELADLVIADGEGERVSWSHAPRERDVVRPLAPDDEAGAVLSAFLRDGAFRRGDGVLERVVEELDLWGQRQLRSLDEAAALTYRALDGLFTVIEASGSARSVLSLVAVAVPRVPLERARELRFVDIVSRRRFRPKVVAVIADAIAPLWEIDRVEMQYTMSCEPWGILIAGTSRQMTTRAELDRRLGLRRVEVTAGGRSWSATSVLAPALPERDAIGEPTLLQLESA